MADNTVRGGGRGRTGVSRAIIVVGLLIFAALVGVIIALVMVLTRRNSEPVVIVREPEPANRSVLVTEDNVDELLEEMAEPPLGYAPTSYEVSMTTDWVFPDGASPSSNAYVENVTDNETPVYFDLMLRDTEEVIYSSPIIPLGEELNNIRLDTDLDAGTYPCVLEYHLVDEYQRTLSTLRVGITISVER